MTLFKIKTLKIPTKFYDTNPSEPLEKYGCQELTVAILLP